MKIIMDMYGGDNAPLAPLKGAEMAVKELGTEIIAVGNEAEMKKICEEENISTKGFTFVDAPLVMPVCAEPTSALKEYKESSLVKGLELLAAGEGDAYVGAGSTGAIVVAATLIVKRIKGIKRAALASVLPGMEKDYMLLDLGANVECRPEMLNQFGMMGSVYMQSVQGIENPTVGLINIGVEESKGTQLQKDAFELMKKANYNFIGNVEVRDVPAGACDVAVADGWTGNIVLKVIEGLGKSFGKMLKAMLMKNLFTKLSALFLKDGIKGFKNKVDSSTRGGAPLLGIAKPVIKAHGNSNPVAFKNAVKQAKIFVETDVNGTISAALAKMKEEAAE
ncbi:MAG: phosphate acyltransferase PlsX [Oscillospiraceae bacterium]|nr:phosphate acyltransferase PlsX [Oscillospiraceae bacterium]